MKRPGLLTIGVTAIAASAVLAVAGTSCGSNGRSFLSGGPSRMGWNGAPGGRSISMDQAQGSVQTFLDQTGNKDLTIDELLHFDRNFYVLIKEKSTGIGAFELLVNPANGAVSFEPGPDMMWNTRYGTMMGGGGGMMGGGGGIGYAPAASAMVVTPEQATSIAQSWLDSLGKGYSAGTPDTLHGYYTIDYQKDGRTAGMLSVNGFTGQVWEHTWHGGFIESRDLGG